MARDGPPSADDHPELLVRISRKDELLPVGRPGNRGGMTLVGIGPLQGDRVGQLQRRTAVHTDDVEIEASIIGATVSDARASPVMGMASRWSESLHRLRASCRIQRPGHGSNG